MPGQESRKRKVRRHGTPRSSLSEDTLGNKGVLRMIAAIHSLAKTWTCVHFIALYLQLAHIRRGGSLFLINHGIFQPLPGQPLPTRTSPHTNYRIRQVPPRANVPFTAIPADEEPLPLAIRGRLETRFETCFGSAILQTIQSPDLANAPASQLDITYRRIVLPQLNKIATPFPNAPVRGDNIDKIDISESKETFLMGELKGYYTKNFGTAIRTLIDVEVKNLLLPDDEAKVLANRLEVFFSPLYIADVNSANPSGLYFLDINHPLFLNDQGRILYGWPDPLRQQCVDLFMDLFSLLVWSLHHQRVGRAVPAAPNPIPPNFSDARFQIKRWGADWDSVIGDRETLYESCAAIMTYMSARHVAQSLDDEDELPPGFSPINAAPRKTRMKIEIIKIDYGIFQGIIIPDIQHKYHSLPAVRKKYLRIRTNNGWRIPGTASTTPMKVQTAYMANFTKKLKPKDQTYEYFPNVRALRGDGTDFYYIKCKEALPITKLYFLSDGDSEFQIGYAWKPTAEQLQRKPHLGIANRVASYEELEDSTYRHQDMPLTDQVFPDTAHTGWLTSLNTYPHLPAAEFLDTPAPGACKVVATDPGQTYLTQSVDRNMTRVRDEYDNQVAQLGRDLAGGVIGQAEHDEGRRLAKEESKSHFRSISGRLYAEQTLVARDERMVAAARHKDHEEWLEKSNAAFPSYNMRMHELEGAIKAVSDTSLAHLAEYIALHASHWRPMSRFVNKTCKASRRHFDRRGAHHHFMAKATLYNSFNMSHKHFMEEGQSLVLRENRKRRKKRKRGLERDRIKQGRPLPPDPKQARVKTLLMWGEGGDGGASKGRRATSQKEMARESAVSAGCGVVLMPEYNSSKLCCTACGSVDFGLPPQLPNGDPAELLSGLTPHRAVKVESLVTACPVKHKIVYGRPRMFGNRPKSGKHKKRMCCVMDDGSLEPTSNHNYTVWKEVTRLMGCTICAPRYPPNTRISNKFRIKDDLNPPPPPQLPPPGAPAQYQPPAQGTQLTHLVPRDGGSSNDIRNSGIAGIRAGGQRPAHNVHPASLARVRILEGNSRNAGPWQNRVQGTYFNNHLHKRATN